MKACDVDYLQKLFKTVENFIERSHHVAAFGVDSGLTGYARARAKWFRNALRRIAVAGGMERPGHCPLCQGIGVVGLPCQHCHMATIAAGPE